MADDDPARETGPDDPEPTRASGGAEAGTEEDRVRALLASTPSETMPEDVATRIDAALRAEATSAAEGASRAENGAAAEVTPIGRARRVRHMLPAVAVAAIVLGIVAVALPQVLSGPGADDGGSSTTNSRQAPEAVAPESQPDTGQRGVQPSPGSTADGADPVTLSSDRFARDVTTRVVRAGLPPPTPPDRAGLRCEGNRLATTDGLRVTVDGRTARLFASGPAQAREFRAIGCKGEEPATLARTTLDTTGG